MHLDDCPYLSIGILLGTHCARGSVVVFLCVEFFKVQHRSSRVLMFIVVVFATPVWCEINFMSHSKM